MCKILFVGFLTLIITSCNGGMNAENSPVSGGSSDDTEKIHLQQRLSELEAKQKEQDKRMDEQKLENEQVNKSKEEIVKLLRGLNFYIPQCGYTNLSCDDNGITARCYPDGATKNFLWCDITAFDIMGEPGGRPNRISIQVTAYGSNFQIGNLYIREEGEDVRVPRYAANVIDDFKKIIKIKCNRQL